MLRNYLHVTFRCMRRQRVYAFVNIIGLSVGLAGAILITTYVRYEFSYESFIPEAQNIFRTVQKQEGNVFLGSDEFVVTPAPLSDAIQAEIPEVVTSSVFRSTSFLLGRDDVFVFESGLEANEHFFEVFGYELERGDAGTVLAEPGTIVLSRNLADRLFTTADPLGHVLKFGDSGDYTVTGVFTDLPKNSHIQFEFVASVLGNPNYINDYDEWSNSGWLTYFRLNNPGEADAVTRKIQEIVGRNSGESSGKRIFRLQSMESIHLGSHSNFEISKNSDPRFVYLLLGTGIAILLLACANYVNLAIARSVRRAKEVGVRKVVGAMRRQIVWQFLTESILTAAISVALALGLVALAMPAFAAFVGQDLTFFSGSFLKFILVVTGFILLVGLLGGLYPSFVASRMQPVLTLKGIGLCAKSGGGLRSVLVTFQFFVSIILIAASLIIYRQISFIQSRDLGYERDHIVSVRLMDRKLRTRVPMLREALIRDPNIVSVSGSGHLPTNIQSSTTVSEWTGKTGDEKVRIYQNGIDHHFIDLYGIPIVDGRGFGPDFPADDSLGSYIINETAFRSFGWDDLDGKSIVRSGRQRPVVGVFRDFHMHSMHQEIMPLMLYLRSDNSSRVSIKLTGADVTGTIRFLEKTIREFSPYPIQIRFVDEVFAQLYENEVKLGSTIGLFTLLALGIGVLGLFGLVAFSAEIRTTEVGVRKVLGASVPSVLLLFARDYTMLLIVASAVGIPVAYAAMNQWLERFIYRISLSPLDFILAVSLLVVVAAVSILYQTLKAAMKNPVHALRYE